MKAYNFRKKGWMLIGLKYLDVFTTIIGVGYLGFREINPLGYNTVIIVSILYPILLFTILKYYHKIKFLKYGMSIRPYYKLIINTTNIIIGFYIFVVINNITQLIHIILK